MQRFFIRRTLVVAFSTLFSLTAVTAARGNEKCSNATLKGSYGLHATGTIIGVGDFAAVGRFTFDGKGNLTGKLFSRVAGNNSVSPAFTGTYSVSPNCKVTDTWGPPINSTHVSMIVNEGKEYFILNDTPGNGTTISGEAKKQFSEDDKEQSSEDD